MVAGRIVISEAVVDLDSVSLVRNQAGVFNAVAFADALNPPATSSTSGSFTTKQVPPYLIKQLTIRVGTVKYFDFDGHDGQPQSQTVNYAQTFTDVTDFKTQVAPALARKFTPVAVAMIGNGTPMPVVSAVLGHASSDTTQAYYLRFDVERLRCCALDVEDVIEEAKAGERDA